MSRIIRKYLDIADETSRLKMEGLEFNEALTKAKEMYEKAHSLTDQDKENEPKKIFNEIITDKEDIDNGEVFDKITGKTVKEL